MPKFFSLREANEEIPELSKTFAKIFAINERIRTVSDELEEGVFVWRDDVFKKKGDYNEHFFNRQMEVESLASQIEETVQGLQNKGIMIKDIDTGLIDFPMRVDNSIVYLCWQYGEKDVSFWHTPEEGFDGRRHIKELKMLEKPNQ